MVVVFVKLKEIALRWMTTLFIVSAVSGCSGSTDQHGARYGGEVIIGSQTKPDVLNPLISGTTVAVNINALIFSGLTKQDSTLANPLPNLASHWNISEDRLTYTFDLRHDVRFHDGVDFTAEDVKFTYDAAKDPENVQAQAFLKVVDTTEVVDRYTVRIKLKRIDPQFLSFGAGFQIVPRHLLEKSKTDIESFNRHPVGTGPFKFDNWADSTRVVLTANETYFAGRPYLDRVIFQVGLPRSTQWELLMRQEIDTMISTLVPEDIEHVQSDSTTFRLYSGLEPRYHMIVYNHEDSRFADRRIRSAISYGLDKQAIIDRALNGKGMIIKGPFGEGSWANNPDVQSVPYNPERSIQLLKETGWRDRNADGILDKNGRLFEASLLIINGDKSSELTALVIRQNLQEIGIKINIEPLDFGALFKTRLNPAEFEMVLIPYTLGSDPSVARTLFYSNQTAEETRNFTRFRNAQIDSLFDADSNAKDERTRQQLYRRIHTIMYEEQPVTFLYSRYMFTPFAKRISGIEQVLGSVDFSTIDKWYVTPQ